MRPSRNPTARRNDRAFNPRGRGQYSTDARSASSSLRDYSDLDVTEGVPSFGTLPIMNSSSAVEDSESKKRKASEEATDTATATESKRARQDDDKKDAAAAEDAPKTRQNGNRNKSNNQNQRRNNKSSRGAPRGPKHPSAGEKAKFKSNIKSEYGYESLPPSETPQDIRKQVQFYLSDSNLLFDKFLVQKVGGPKNNPVSLKLLHSFKRMQRFQPYSIIPAALAESTTLILTKDPETGEDFVQRKTPLPEEVDAENPSNNNDLFEKLTAPRTLYAKGFGTEHKRTQVDVEHHFEQFAEINAVRLRRTFPTNFFKGSAFVEFVSQDEAQAFLDRDDKPKFQRKDGDCEPTELVDLEVMWKKDFVAEKKAEAEARARAKDEAGKKDSKQSESEKPTGNDEKADGGDQKTE